MCIAVQEKRSTDDIFALLPFCPLARVYNRRWLAPGFTRFLVACAVFRVYGPAMRQFAVEHFDFYRKLTGIECFVKSHTAEFMRIRSSLVCIRPRDAS